MIEDACQYHRLTAYHRARLTPHRLDWERRPSLFKEGFAAGLPLLRPDLTGLITGRGFADLGRLAGWARDAGASPVVVAASRERLSALLLLTAAVTGRAIFSGGEIRYRSHPSAGALYPLELYLLHPESATLCFSGLEAGFYHYDLRRPALEPVAGQLPRLFDPEDSRCPLLLISAVFARSLWKYRARAWRYILLDAGHLLGNLELALAAVGLGAEIIADFPDAEVARRCGFAAGRETVLLLVRLLGGTEPAASPVDGSFRELLPHFRVGSPVSAFRPPEMPPAPESEGLSGCRELLEGVRATITARISPESDGNAKCGESLAAAFPELEKWVTFAAAAGCGPGPELTVDYPEILRRRRSRRNFDPVAEVGAETLFWLLRRLADSRRQNADAVQPGVVLAVQRIAGLTDGLYLVDLAARRLARYGGDGFSSLALGRAALDQGWVGLAGMVFIFFAELEKLVAVHGSRSYRELHFIAGVLAQRLYLGAECLGLGACGVGAFFDCELAAAVKLPEGCEPLYLLALGRCRKRADSCL